GGGRHQAHPAVAGQRAGGAPDRHSAALGLHRRGQARVHRQHHGALHRRRQHPDARVEVVPGQRGEGVMATQDIIARSATTTPAPSIRQVEEVAKLIDVSKCIGCKACEAACSEWNELRDEVGSNHGTYDNPIDLTAESWTVMRFTEHEKADGDLEWLIRKDGCMHCAEPGCLTACPSPGAIVKYANGIVD